ncbi:MAG: hypothetical protein IKO93_15275 [Lentisphaeria bacterium]|nr:hypothetical protein [Lentisphaeria bacterium]
MTGPRWKKVCLILTWIIAPAVFLAGLFFLVLTPYALRDIWLPAAARSAGVTAQAEKISLVSMVPFRVRAVNFHYADSEVSLDIAQIISGLSLRKLKKHQIELHDTRMDNIRMRTSLVAGTHAPAAGSPASPASDRKNHPPVNSGSSEPWQFSMYGFELKNAVFEYENRERKVVQGWSMKSLRGNRFLPEEICSITADSFLRVYPDKQNPIEIRALPFHLKADYRLDRSFRLKFFIMDLKTGICDFAIPGVFDIRALAGIRAVTRVEGSFPDPETLRIARSEIRLFKDSKLIGRLQCKGETGRRFQFDGVLSDLDLQPYLSLFASDSKVSLNLSRAEFAVTGSDFSPVGIRKDLKVRVIAEIDRFSLPVELNRNNRLIRLVMIPIEVLPTFLELITLKWNLRKELVQCANSVQAVVSGKQNLNFERAALDISMETGILNIRNFTLNGKDIEMESIRGTLDLVTEEIDLRTIVIVNDLKLPIHFKGTLGKPAPYFKESMKDFVTLNAPLLQKLESLLSEPPSPKDSKSEKAIKRGYRDLQRYIR